MLPDKNIQVLRTREQYEEYTKDKNVNLFDSGIAIDDTSFEPYILMKAVKEERKEEVEKYFYVPLRILQ